MAILLSRWLATPRCWSLLTFITIVSSCGIGKKDDDTPPPPNKPTGCLQGVVVNGLTGERVMLPKPNKKVGIYSLVRSELKAGKLLTSNDDKGNANLHGEYTLCGLPLDETFPVFAWVEGYLPYETLVQVESTIASRTSMAKEDIDLQVPTEIVNIRLYPVGKEAQDLKVNVLYSGAPLAKATVYLRPSGTNFLDPYSSGFQAPVDVRQVPLSGVTDDNGQVVFKGADLVLGCHYTYVVIPPDGGARQTVNTSASAFVMGLRSTAGPSDPYNLFIDLEHSIGGLAEISRSTDAGDLEASGKLVIYFDRDIEIVPGTVDLITATLTGATTAVLPTAVADNDASESVNYEIANNVLTLTPKWKTQPDADTKKELELAITYSGITVRPKESPLQTSTVSVTGTVRFYK